MITDLEGWYRTDDDGIQFYATDNDVAGWLRAGLPAEYAPYHLVSADPVQVAKRRYLWKPVVFDVSEFPGCRACGGEPWDDRWKFFIHSTAISGELPLGDVPSVDNLCSLNGLITLIHGLCHRDQRTKRVVFDDSSVSVVKTVANYDKGQVVSHPEYHAVYRSLVKVIKKDLTHTTLLTDPASGQVTYEDSDIRMTEQAAEAYTRGVPYRVKPGRRI